MPGSVRTSTPFQFGCLARPRTSGNNDAAWRISKFGNVRSFGRLLNSPYCSSEKLMANARARDRNSYRSRSRRSPSYLSGERVHDQNRGISYVSTGDPSTRPQFLGNVFESAIVRFSAETAERRGGIPDKNLSGPRVRRHAFLASTIARFHTRLKLVHGQTNVGERLAGQPARPAAVGRP